MGGALGDHPANPGLDFAYRVSLRWIDAEAAVYPVLTTGCADWLEQITVSRLLVI